jgi:hypothetical protein
MIMLRALKMPAELMMKEAIATILLILAHGFVLTPLP